MWLHVTLRNKYLGFIDGGTSWMILAQKLRDIQLWVHSNISVYYTEKQAVMCTIILNIEEAEKIPKFLSGFLILKSALLRLYYFLRKYPLPSNTKRICNCSSSCCQRLWALRENQHGRKLGRYLEDRIKRRKEGAVCTQR